MTTTKNKKKNANGEMALTGHLSELRNRLIVCIIFLVIGFGVCFHFSTDIVNFLVDQGRGYGYEFVFIAPQEMIIQYLKVGIVGAVIICLPVLLFEIWAFVKPGLMKNENLFFLFAMLLGLCCFAVGVAFAYFISLPFMLQFLININTSAFVTATITVENYISFVLMVYLIFGIVFEIPMVSVVLTKLGLLKPEWMKAARPYMIVVMFVVAAIITPPDIVSQTMVAIPMIVLYEISILLCKVFRKQRDKKLAQETDDNEE